MNEERLGSTAAFAEQLAAHLSLLAPSGPALPDARDLAALVEIGFFAGLHEEESRRTEFTLAWTGGAQHCSAAVALRAPVLATPKTIAKLAPAAKRDATSLAIRRDGNDLVIWALLQHGAHLPLSVRSLAAGVLRVDYLGIPRALYARGEILFLGEPHEVKSPARRLTSVFAAWAREATDPPHVDPRAATVTRIAARALEHGHGGMILLAPKHAEPHGVRMHYEAGPGSDLLSLRYEELMTGAEPHARLARIGPRDRSAARDSAHARYDEAIDFVASLTATDNALLLDTDLRVRAFGVQVIESETPLEPFRHVNPYTDDEHVDDISTFKGTRHPAGVIFCLRQPGEAAAIIASQDGRLSLVVKDAKGVEVLGSYERAFGWR
jgi:hypothetical protein